MIDQAELMKSVLAVRKPETCRIRAPRILMMLPTQLRVNVTVIDAQNEPLTTATLMLDQKVK